MDNAVTYSLIAIVVLVMVALCLPTLTSFTRKRKYIRMKILNSRSHQEQAYWERRKRKLWLSLLPFCHYNRHEHHHDDH